MSSKNILILKGFKLSDFDINDEPKEFAEDEPKFFNERATKWIEGDELNAYPDLKCWNCDDQCSHESIFIPVRPKYVDNKIQYERFGNYCSWPCAAKDAHCRFGNMKDYSDIKENLRNVFNIINNTNVPFVKYAPDKTQINEYSGNSGLSRIEYRQELKKIFNNMKKY